MIFSEIYGAYYNAVARILKAAVDHPVQISEIRKIAAEYAFDESRLSIEPMLTEGKWQLLRKDGTTEIQKAPEMPLTTIQKRWLKAIAQDPRVKLFDIGGLDFPDVEPLFRQEDIRVFDKYTDGDPYEDEAYKAIFRMILDAVHNHYPLAIDALSRKGNTRRYIMMPMYIEYSEKDDKFRLVGGGNRFGGTLNLTRIVHCERCNEPFKVNLRRVVTHRPRTVVLELSDERNALERVLLHFAHFEKQAERIDGNRYQLTITYDKDDETEIVIRVLSFGPMVRVIKPDHFVDLIRERLIDQKSCGL